MTTATATQSALPRLAFLGSIHEGIPVRNMEYLDKAIRFYTSAVSKCDTTSNVNRCRSVLPGGAVATRDTQDERSTTGSAPAIRALANTKCLSG